jgi:hypothetical protein
MKRGMRPRLARENFGACPVKEIDVRSISTSPAKRLEFLEAFVGFTDDDWKALRDSVEVLGPKLPAVLDALYEHLLSFDDTKRIFIGKKGEVDPHYLAVRKEHLTDWVLKTVGSKDFGREEFAAYLVNVGRKHTGVEGESQRVVPPRYMVALTGFIQSALWSTLFAAIPERPNDVLRMGNAWSKMMVMQLEIFLKTLAPHWPKWDEAWPSH